MNSVDDRDALQKVYDDVVIAKALLTGIKAAAKDPVAVSVLYAPAHEALNRVQSAIATLRRS